MSNSNQRAKASDLRNLASQQIRANQLDAAQGTLEALIRENPQDVPACLELADLMYRRGQIRDSSAPLLLATQHLPRHAQLLLILAQHLIARGEVLAARDCLDFLAQAPDPPADVLLSQVHLRFSLGEVETARKLMQRALDAGADSPPDHHLHAMLLQFTGDIEGSCRVLERSLQRWPDFADALVPLVGMRKQTPENNRLAFAEERLRALPKHSPEPAVRFAQAEFEYARFRILDKLHRHEEAWPSLARCNKLMHALNPYEGENEAALISDLMALPASLGRNEVTADEFTGPTPIFIVGMPRTGTTLLERMLSSHTQVTGAGELIEFWRQLHWVADEQPNRTHSLRQIIKRHEKLDVRELGARYLEQTQWRAGGHRFYIDKLPANIQMVAFIRRALPHAPILHMMRDPMDVCFSNFKAFFGNDSSTFSYDLQSVAHYYRQYHRLSDHWRTAIPGAMLDVPYASLVSDPASTMQGVLEFCGLDVEPACLHPEKNASPVATPSSAQVREPIHSRSIGEWRNYAQQLEPLRQALE